MEEGAGGVSSFGYSGAIAHAVLVVDAMQEAEVVSAGVAGGESTSPPPPLVYWRHAFPWRELAHPFAQRLIPVSDGSHTLNSPATGVLHALVTNHVVQGRVIFPGAGHLEMVRVAACAVTSASATGATLHGVFFLQPLAVEAPGLQIECVVAAGRFEVRGGSHAADDWAVHCSGALVAGAQERWHPPERASERASSCVHASAGGALYDAFDAIGLQYGPGYRTLAQAWGGGVARLRARATHEGTAVHPADLDDALCVGMLASSGEGGGGTRLPYAVDEARLQGAPGELWAVRRCPLLDRERSRAC